MKARMILLLAALAATGVVHAQTLDAFRNKLRAPNATYDSRVEVTEHDAAASAVRSLQARPSGERISGYRVRIFFDNGQNARTQAQSVAARFRELYPSIPVYTVYENPYFKVTVGNCLNVEEAIILEGKVKNAFDGAFKVREEIPLTLFGEQLPEPSAPPVTSGAEQ